MMETVGIMNAKNVYMVDHLVTLKEMMELGVRIKTISFRLYVAHKVVKKHGRKIHLVCFQ